MSGYDVGKYVPVGGPLAEVAEDFAEVLWERGYSARTVDCQMRMLLDLSGWLKDAGIALAALDNDAVETYVAQRRLRTQTLRSSRGLAPLLGFLRDQGVVPPPSPAVVADGPTRILAGQAGGPELAGRDCDHRWEERQGRRTPAARRCRQRAGRLAANGPSG